MVETVEGRAKRVVPGQSFHQRTGAIMHDLRKLHQTPLFLLPDE